MEFNLADVLVEHSYVQNSEESFGDATPFNQLVFDVPSIVDANDTGFLPNLFYFDSQIPGFDEWHSSPYGTLESASVVWLASTNNPVYLWYCIF